VLIDSARHFLPVSAILTVLDAMAYSKLNVLHWHLVDDDSFPYVSKALPKLSNAAFSPSHTYKRQEVEEILEYARDRGIRVMPEFDTPGHTKAWGVGYPEIMTECHNPKPGSVAHGGITGLGVINPALNQTYELIGKLWAELAEVFPDQYIHLGGDEVDQACWNSNQARVVSGGARGHVDTPRPRKPMSESIRER
jgi:hexosaminidase